MSERSWCDRHGEAETLVNTDERWSKLKTEGIIQVLRPPLEVDETERRCHQVGVR